MRLARPTCILSVTLSVAAAALINPAAQAQAFRCTGPGGTYYSDRVCPPGGTASPVKSGDVSATPPPAPVVPGRPAPPVPRPTDHLSYMSAECTSLSDGLRTAPPRGRYSGSQAELRADYNRRCAAEEIEAKRRWQYDLGRQRRGQAEQQEQARTEAQRSEAEQQRTMEQCREMRRIIAGKNERLAQLTAGELADLRRFEGNFVARCQQRAP